MKTIYLAIILAFTTLAFPASDGKAATDSAANGIAPGRRADFIVDDAFSSRLPLVIVEAEHEKSSLSEKESTKMREVHVAFSLVAGDGPENRPGDRPSVKSRALLSRLDAPLGAEGKGRYAVRLVTDDGRENRQSILGMPANDAWSIVGSDTDKTMLRNYLARAIAAEIMPNLVPEAQFCELLRKNGNRYDYFGVYLFSELTRQGVGMSPDAVGDKEFIVLTNPGIAPEQSGGDDPILADGRYTVLHPGKEADAERIAAIGNEINRVEEMLYSENHEFYFSHEGLLDIDSFVDTFLLNEITSNYGDAVRFCLFKRKDGRLCASPVWDFDTAIDNSAEPQPPRAATEAYWWFPRLLLSADFDVRLKNRYYSLARRELNPTRLGDLVGDVSLYLGPAMRRDWRRWNRVYIDEGRRLLPALSDDGELLARRTDSLAQELIKIKVNLRHQDREMKRLFAELETRKGVLTAAMRVRRNFVWVGVFVVLFFFAVHYARSRM